MRIETRKDRCEGYGQCRFNAPDVFDVDEEGMVVVLTPRPEEELRSEVEAAADSCPVQAITVTE